MRGASYPASRTTRMFGGGSLPPLASVYKAADDVTDLVGGDRGQSEPGSSRIAVQQRGPRGPARLQRGDDRVRPAGHHLVLAQAPAVGVAERAVRARVGVRPHPR